MITARAVGCDAHSQLHTYTTQNTMSTCLLGQTTHPSTVSSWPGASTFPFPLLPMGGLGTSESERISTSSGSWDCLKDIGEQVIWRVNRVHKIMNLQNLKKMVVIQRCLNYLLSLASHQVSIYIYIYIKKAICNAKINIQHRK